MEPNINIIGHESRILYLSKLLRSEQHSRTLLLTGIPGIGKSLTAKYIFNSLICTEKDSPCGKCAICRQFANNTYPDFFHIKPDDDGKIKIGDKNGNEDGTVRWLIRRLTETAHSGRYFVLIEDADRITEAGQNALLKTIEEPNQGTFIILTASSVNSIIQTIRSRTMHIKFNPLSHKQIYDVLKKKNPNLDDEFLEFAAIASGGSVEYAEKLLNNEVQTKIESLCVNLKKMILLKTPSEISFSQTAKDVAPVDLTSLMMNIFQYNLESLITKTPHNKHFDKLYIDEQSIILKLLKVLASLKKSEVYNINKDNALKAMISDIDNPDSELPFFEHVQI